MIKRYIKKAQRMWRARSGHCRPCYAQEGEDRILAELFQLQNRRNPGFYVDVGAHDPQRCSNTFLFYAYGWRGINIDAMPGSMVQFQSERPRDINIEAAIADDAKDLTYYEFNEALLNSFSFDVAAMRDHYKSWKIINKRQITTTRLDRLLEQHLPRGQAIDFMSVDVEGLDIDVLKSNNWSKFRPAVVLVEDSEAVLLDRRADTGITRYMGENGYNFCCKTILTTFFVENDRAERTPMGLRIKDV